MYLKSIELSGFKSFTNRTVIKLEDGISCIVGSGKSNIADAVRWVLGEQSAKILRGHKMEDIIFAGSDKRKPLGMAEVILNIDNSDGSLPLEYSAVAVCRRAYRDGESEYLLNGRQCRLADIRELFMDSGVSNNSLALIGQGRIQEVVNMKADERRLLLEDAAGIVKYRSRKQTAQRKLADTEQNLTRIWDIISELTVRLAPLAEQSSRAETYLQLKENADKQEINLILQNMAENRQAMQENTAALAEAQKLAETAETSRLRLEADLAQARLAYDQLEGEITAARQQLFELKTGREQAEAQSELWQEKIRAAEDNIQRLQGELSQLLQQDSGFVAEVERLKRRLNCRRRRRRLPPRRKLLRRSVMRLRNYRLSRSRRGRKFWITVVSWPICRMSSLFWPNPWRTESRLWPLPGRILPLCRKKIRKLAAGRNRCRRSWRIYNSAGRRIRTAFYSRGSLWTKLRRALYRLMRLMWLCV